MSLNDILETVRKMDVRDEADLLEFIIKDFFRKTGVKQESYPEDYARRVEEAQSAYDFLNHEIKSGNVPSDDEINYYHNVALRNNESR